MKYKLMERAEKLMEAAMPMLDKMADDGDSVTSERELDATMKVVELAHYLMEIDMMKHKMMDPDQEMEYGEMADNPKKKEY